VNQLGGFHILRSKKQSNNIKVVIELELDLRAFSVKAKKIGFFGLAISKDWPAYLGPGT
jgi:hypothetical protein